MGEAQDVQATEAVEVTTADAPAVEVTQDAAQDDSNADTAGE